MTELEYKVIELATLRGWTDPEVEYLKLVEEVGELAKAIGRKDTANIFEEAGDVLFVATNLHILENGKFYPITAEKSIYLGNLLAYGVFVMSYDTTAGRETVWSAVVKILGSYESATIALDSAYEKNLQRTENA